MRIRTVVVVVAGVVIMGLGTLRVRFALAQRVPLPSEAERVADLALLWREAAYNFVFFDRVPELDWDSAFTAFVPQVQAASTSIEHVRVLQRFVALLGEGHTSVVPDRKLWRRHAGAPGVELEVVEGRPVVVNRVRSLAEAVPLGSVVRSVNGVPADGFLSDSVLPFVSAATDQDRILKAVRGRSGAGVGLLDGRVGTEVVVELETADGPLRSVSLERHPPRERLEWVETPRRDRKIFALRELDGDLVHVELNGFHDAEVVRAFEAALPVLRRARGIVLDVRANQGGSSRHALAIAGHFATEPVLATRSRARENVSAYRAWGRSGSASPYRDHWDGKAWRDLGETRVEPRAPHLAAPVAVLSGPATYSAAEDFLAYMKVVPRSVQIGQTSAGSTGQPLRIRLGTTARAAITAKRDVLPDGTTIVGNGVSPDIVVAPTLDDVRRDRDPVLERALEHLRRAGSGPGEGS